MHHDSELPPQLDHLPGGEVASRLVDAPGDRCHHPGAVGPMDSDENMSIGGIQLRRREHRAHEELHA